MPKRECLDCRRLIDNGSRCPTCQATARPTTTLRGYDAQHQRARDEWAPYVAAGLVDCRRGDQCVAPQLRIGPDEPWDLGHPDAQCPQPTAPEHRRCNRGAPRRRR